MNDTTNITTITALDVAKALRVISAYFEQLDTQQDTSIPLEALESPKAQSKQVIPTSVCYETVADIWGVRPDCIRGIMRDCKLDETRTSGNEPAIKEEDAAVVVAELRKKIGDYKKVPRNTIVKNAIIKVFGSIRHETRKTIKNNLFV